MALDAAGNVYVAGEQDGTGAFTYGAGVTATGTAGFNPLLLKYDSAGVAQWARTVVAGPGLAFFNGIAVDPAGQVFVVGQQFGSGTFSDGGTATAAGSFALGYNLALVKYDAAGSAQWARSTTSGPGASSTFQAVSLDAAGNVFAAGSQNGRDPLGSGGDITAQGANLSGDNAVLVRYGPSGVAQWARTGSSFNDARFSDVVADATGEVFAAGRQAGSGTYSYGNGVSVAGTHGSGGNVVLIRYR